MSLIKRNPKYATSVTPFRQLQEQMNWLFDNGWSNWPGFAEMPEAFQPSFQPRVETFEKGDKIEVSAELPGMDEKDIQLQLSADAAALIITGEKKYEKEEKDEERNFYHTERTYGRFQRAVPLPTPVDAEKIKATYKNGVLKVKMRRIEASQSRSIPVST